MTSGGGGGGAVSRAVRRGSMHLRNLGKSENEAGLNLVISEVSSLRHAARQFTDAQSKVMTSLSAWANKNDVGGIGDVTSQTANLFAVWNSMQTQFIDSLRGFCQNFHAIVESQKTLDIATSNLACCEKREQILKKEIRKMRRKSSSSKSPPQEMFDAEKKLREVEETRTMAKIDVRDRDQEMAALKLNGTREALLKFSESYLELFRKSGIIFSSTKLIASELPVATKDKHAQTIEFNKGAVIRRHVFEAKALINDLKKRPSRSATCPTLSNRLSPMAPPVPQHCTTPPAVPPHGQYTHAPAAAPPHGQYTTAPAAAPHGQYTTAPAVAPPHGQYTTAPPAHRCNPTLAAAQPSTLCRNAENPPPYNVVQSDPPSLNNCHCRCHRCYCP